MSWPRSTKLSIAANVALLGIVGYSLWALKNTPIPEPPPPRIITSTVTQIAARKIVASNFWAVLAAHQTPNWTHLESTNYTIYIENLRSIGCPEETIRDIIIADVAKLYAKKRAALRAQLKPAPFWRPETEVPPENIAIREELKLLDDEERVLIKQLLNVDLEAELVKYSPGEDLEDNGLSFLPEEKQKKLLALQQQYAEAEQVIYHNARGIILDEDQERIRKLELQKEKELRELLTPEELEEYLLRKSSTAANLRGQMTGFNATEDEFRKIFRLQKTYDDEFENAFDITDEGQLEIRARAESKAREALNDEIKKIVGEERYNEFERAKDPDYQTLVQIADRYAISRDAAAKVYSMRQDAERQKAALEENLNLSADRRQAALDALARETQRAIAATLGGNQGNAWAAYKRNSGQWMESLNVSEVPELEPMPEPVDNMMFPPRPPDVPDYLLPPVPPLIRQ